MHSCKEPSLSTQNLHPKGHSGEELGKKPFTAPLCGLPPGVRAGGMVLTPWGTFNAGTTELGRKHLYTAVLLVGLPRPVQLALGVLGLHVGLWPLRAPGSLAHGKGGLCHE